MREEVGPSVRVTGVRPVPVGTETRRRLIERVVRTFLEFPEEVLVGMEKKYRVVLKVEETLRSELFRSQEEIGGDVTQIVNGKKKDIVEIILH